MFCLPWFSESYCEMAKFFFHIEACYNITGMFVKRCSAEQKSMVRFPKICSTFFKEKSQQNNINKIF